MFPPSIGSFRFADALDVIEDASLEGLMGWRTWPAICHLDDGGLMQCASRSTSLDSIRLWARDPSELLKVRRVGVAETGRAPRWLIKEPRTAICAARTSMKWMRSDRSRQLASTIHERLS